MKFNRNQQIFRYDAKNVKKRQFQKKLLKQLLPFETLIDRIFKVQPNQQKSFFVML